MIPPSLIGQTLSHFRITAILGEGGMGVVYRAQDIRLGREVAIKVLPESWISDPERIARFEREAKLLASLNHPNIATIYEVGQAEGGQASFIRFIAMELVEGPTLASLLEAGPLPLEECVAFARQMAEALEEAHEKGIVHRDLKPQNVKVSAQGQVKVLDFGLAKALKPGSGVGVSSDLPNSPTATFGETRQGVILGTVAYMAPEQARGAAVDKRADIWAFGAVLFEMLTGTRLFVGDSVVDVLGAVTREPIDFVRLPPGTPSPLRELVARCLERNPRNRLRDIGDARLALTDTVASPAGGLAVVAPPQEASRRSRLPWLVATAAIIALLGQWLLRSDQYPTRPAGSSASFRQLTFLPGGEQTPALAPDGESVVFAKKIDGQLDLFLQRVDGRNPVPLTAACVQDDSEPAISPDGRRIAYRSECAGGGIFVMGATGESARRVSDFGYSPSWSPDGRELAVVTEIPFIPYAGLSTASALWAVEVETGKRRKVSDHDARLPAWSPDGRRIAFWGQVQPASNREVWSVAADGSEPGADRGQRVTEDSAIDWGPAWSPDGAWLYFSSTRGGTMNLWRVGVEPATGRTRGDPEPVVVPSGWVGWPSFARGGRRFAFVDRNMRTAILRAPFEPNRGELIGVPRQVETGSIEVWLDGFDLAPDGSSVLFSTAGMPQHLMTAQAEGRELRQLTEGPDRYRQGRFSPDGSWIALQAARFPGRMALLRPDGSGMRELASDRTEGWWPVWSPDGSRLAVSEEGTAYLLELAATTAKGSTTALPLAPQGLAFSPSTWSRDGRLLAGNLVAGGARGGIAQYSLAERRYRVVSALGRAKDPHFLPDNRQLVWTTGQELVLHDLATGQNRVIRTAPPGRELVYAVPSYDGKWIAWLEIADESDIWLASFGDTVTPRP